MNTPTLEILWSTERPSAWQTDGVAVGIFEGGTPQPALKHLGAAVVAMVEEMTREKWFLGRKGDLQVVPIPARAHLPARRLMLLGLGKAEKLTPERLREIGGTLVAQANAQRMTSLATLLPMDRLGSLRPAETIACLAEGAWLGDYRFDGYQEKKKEEGSTPTCRQLLLAISRREAPHTPALLEKTRAVATGVYLARDLSNHPANIATPDYLAQTARAMAHELPLKVSVLDEKALAKEGMNGILGVGKGSAHPPCMIVVEYHGSGKREERAPLVVVGKAVTFDSGGISIKPGAGMEEMKFDMSGGAAVLGFMLAAATLGLPLDIVGLVPAAENMPSGTAQRPGDIVKTAKGLFVEVINTDAEGRMLLADALHYAARFTPSAIIDLATLTGACVIALGGEAAGLMGNNDTLIEAVRRAGEASGERVWPLPLFEEYHEQLKSPVADMKNVGNREAGAILGGCFLSRFVEEGRPWAHIDIAGMMRDFSGKRPHIPKGSPGYGVRLLVRLAGEYPF